MGSTLWQSQSIEAPRLSLEYVRHQATKLNADRRRELVMMYVGMGAMAIAVVVVFLMQARNSLALLNLFRIGVVLSALGLVYTLMQVRRRTHALSDGDGEKVMTSLEAYRAELQRRRDYYSYMGNWRAQLPAAPGLGLLLLFFVLFDTGPGNARLLGIFCLLVVIGTGFGVAFAWAKRRKFQRELDALSTLERG